MSGEELTKNLKDGTMEGREELQDWKGMGAIQVLFGRITEASEESSGGCD